MRLASETIPVLAINQGGVRAVEKLEENRLFRKWGDALRPNPSGMKFACVFQLCMRQSH